MEHKMAERVGARGAGILKQAGPFEPAEGTIVASPLGSGAGGWAGAPGVVYDPDGEKFYLVYRLRKPRDLGRGRGDPTLHLPDARGSAGHSTLSG